MRPPRGGIADESLSQQTFQFKREKERPPTLVKKAWASSDSGGLLDGRRRRGQREGTSLRVTADGPPLARVDDGTAELGHTLECRAQVGDREVRKRSSIARSGSTTVNAESKTIGVGLPPRSRRGRPGHEIDAKNSTPEAASAIWVVGGKLDQWCGHEVSVVGRGSVAASSSTRGAGRRRRELG